VRLGEPVGVQQQLVAGRDGRGGLLIGAARQQPQRHAGGAQLGHAVLAAQVGEVVAGVGEAQLAAGRVEHGVQAGDEHVLEGLAQQQVVGALQHLGRRPEPRRLGAQDGHEEWVQQNGWSWGAIGKAQSSASSAAANLGSNQMQ